MYMHLSWKKGLERSRDENLQLLSHCSAACERPCCRAHIACCRKEREQLFFRVAWLGNRVFEGSQPCRTSTRSAIAVSTYGRIRQRQPAGGRRGFPFRTAE